MAQNQAIEGQGQEISQEIGQISRALTIQEIEQEQTAQESLNKIIVQTLNNSIKPSIEETERFILFLNQKFNLGIDTDSLIINIQDTSTSTKGFFMPKEHKNHYETTAEKKKLYYICLSSLYLNNTPYETIAHETAHLINEIQGHQAKNNYHTKEFKRQAEQLLLKVEKAKNGYATTSETEEFKNLVQEFKPSETAFKIYQHKQNKKVGSRNLLFMCGCGVKVRTAKNEDKPFMAKCLYCNSEFKEQNKKVEGEDEN